MEAEETSTMTSQKDSTYRAQARLAVDAEGKLSASSRAAIEPSAPSIKAAATTTLSLENNANKVTLAAAGVSVEAASDAPLIADAKPRLLPP